MAKGPIAGAFWLHFGDEVLATSGRRVIRPRVPFERRLHLLCFTLITSVVSRVALQCTRAVVDFRICPITKTRCSTHAFVVEQAGFEPACYRRF